MDSKESKDIEQFVLDRYEPITGGMIAGNVALIIVFAVLNIFIGWAAGLYEISLVVWCTVVVVILRCTYRFEAGKRSLRAHIMYRGIANSMVALGAFGIILWSQIDRRYTYIFVFVVAIVFMLLANVVSIRMAKYKECYLNDKVVKSIEKEIPEETLKSIKKYRYATLVFMNFALFRIRNLIMVPPLADHIILVGILTIICVWYTLGASKSYHMLYLIRKYCPHIADNFGGKITWKGEGNAEDK